MPRNKRPVNGEVDGKHAVRALAAKRGATPGQLALAWLLGRGEDVVPIPGTKRVKYLEENAGAAGLVLEGVERAALDAALAPGRVAGPRYDAERMKTVDR